MHPSRRSFLKTSALAFTALSASRVLGANDSIRLGLIGVGSRGMQTAKEFMKVPGVSITHICDVDTRILQSAATSIPGVKTEQDLRKIIENPDIDAVAISTGNHWHALAAIWAIQAGKDVYVEKPVSHNVHEGRVIVEAARKHKRIVQGGTQQRSDPFHAELKEFLDSNPVGEAKFVRCNHYSQRGSIGKQDKPLTPPATVNHDLWLGPAEDLPMFRKNYHYDWHWSWNTGDGELGNWGPHIMDDLRNIVFRDRIAFPKRVLAGGGRFGWDDAGETPNTHWVYMDTGEIPVLFDIHNLPSKKGVNAPDTYMKRKTRAFLVIEFEGGYYAGGRGSGAVHDQDGKVIRKFVGDAGKDHVKNFIDAVRSRNIGDLNGEIEQIHYSSAWCHLGNLSWRLGQAYSREQAEAAVGNFEPWKELISEFHTHLEANEIDLTKEDARLGAALTIDVANQGLAVDSATPEALALWQGTYRKGYELPVV